MHKPSENKKLDAFLEQHKLNREDFPVLIQFPKEFRRNWLKQFDARFMIILVSTFFVGISFIVSFLSWGAGKGTDLDANSIQKRYAKLLLDKSIENDFLNNNSKTPDTYLYGVPDEMENRKLSFDNQERLQYGSSGTETDIQGRSSAGMGSGVSANSRQSGFEGSASSYGSGSAEKIGSMGILGYLSEDNNASNEELNEIYAQDGHNTQYLEGSLANVKIANFNQRGENAAGGTGEGGGIAFAGVKGSKRTVSNSEVQASLVPLEQAEFRTVAKNTELEESSVSLLTRTGKKATARKAEHITKVVLDHNRAIQDCYKQALKKLPELKGKVVVRFSVTPEGKVDLVEVITSTIEFEPMMNCIISRIRRWNDFGESDISLGTVSYRQTYVFGY